MNTNFIMDQIASFELLSISYPETSRFVMHQHPELSMPFLCTG